MLPFFEPEVSERARGHVTMQRRLAVYRVLRIAGVALPAIAAYRWLETRERLGWPAPPVTWDRVHDRWRAACTTSASIWPDSS